jgi:hypothetical protein
MLRQRSPAGSSSASAWEHCVPQAFSSCFTAEIHLRVDAARPMLCLLRTKLVPWACDSVTGGGRMTISVSDLCVRKSTSGPNRAYLGNQRQEVFRTLPSASNGIGPAPVPLRPGRRAPPRWVRVVVVERFWLGLNPRGGCRRSAAPTGPLAGCPWPSGGRLWADGHGEFTSSNGLLRQVLLFLRHPGPAQRDIRTILAAAPTPVEVTRSTGPPHWSLRRVWSWAGICDVHDSGGKFGDTYYGANVAFT